MEDSGSNFSLEDDRKCLNYRLLLEKVVHSSIRCHSWCPSLDLIAFAGSDGSLCVHRLSWDTVFVNNREKCSSQKKGFENITAIAWRPDGHVLAAGHADGEVVLHASDGGDVLIRLPNLGGTGDIAAIYWIKLANHLFEKDRSSDLGSIGGNACCSVDELLLPLAPVQSGPMSPSDGPLSATVASSRIVQNYSASFDVLVSVNSDCTAVLNAFGVFELGRVDVSLQIDSRIVGVFIPPDMSAVAFLVSSKDMDGVDRSVHLSLYDSSILSLNRTVLRGLAVRAASLQSIVSYLLNSTSLLKEKWQSGRKLVNTKFQALIDLLKDHGEELTARDEFVALLSGGLAGPALLQFLENSLGQRGVSRLQKQIDSVYGECVQICGKLLRRSVDRVIFAVNELHALSQWRDRYAAIGLSVDAAKSLLENVEYLASIISETYGEIVSARAQFGVFFKWLGNCLENFGEEEEGKHIGISRADFQTLSEFFGTKGAFENEQTTLYLGDVIEAKQDTMSFLPSPLASKNQNASHHESIICEGKLIETATGFAELVRTALAAPSKKMSKNFSHIGSVKLYKGDYNDGDCLQRGLGGIFTFVESLNESYDKRLAFVPPSSPDSVVIAEYSVGDQSSKHEISTDSFEPISPSIWRVNKARIGIEAVALDVSGKCVDIQFKKDGSLAVIAESNPGEFSLCVFEFERDRLTPIPSASLSQPGSYLESMCETNATEEPVYSRVISTTMKPASLSVGMRGTAAIVFEPSFQKVHVYDLEDEEYVDEDAD